MEDQSQRGHSFINSFLLKAMVYSINSQEVYLSLPLPVRVLSVLGSLNDYIVIGITLLGNSSYSMLWSLIDLTFD